MRTLVAASMTEIVLWKAGATDDVADATGEGESGVGAELREDGGDVVTVLGTAAVWQAARNEVSTTTTEMRSFERLSAFTGPIMSSLSNCPVRRR